ncbi:MAG: transglycosylase SLT domain-containing protein [Bacteroidota bacterium]
MRITQFTPVIKRIVLLLLLSSYCLVLSASASSYPPAAYLEARAEYIMEVSDSLVKARLSLLDASIMEHRFDKSVKRRIVNYLEQWPVATGRLLARSARFFPIFEEQLLAAGMPVGLKYMTVQESALRPVAVSHVGAGGLWQLMPGTARELGLTVNEVLDERLDPELVCAAGLHYLRIQYERYEDWALALAAYNCGPGNVNKALRRSRGRDYWSIRRHLPRETRNYLPNIIAATYVMAFHHEHELPPSSMSLDLQLTEAITVYRRLSLWRVAQVTGLRPAVVLELNPQYLKGYLPGMKGGHRLRLPKRVIPAMRTYLSTHSPDQPESDFHLPWTSPLLHEGATNSDRYYQQFRTVPGSLDTTLRQVATTYGLPVDQLAVWSNRGELDSLKQTDDLYFYRVADYLPYDPRQRNPPPPAPLLTNQPPAPISIPNRRPLRLEPHPAPAAAPKRIPFTERIKRWFQ